MPMSESGVRALVQSNVSLRRYDGCLECMAVAMANLWKHGLLSYLCMLATTLFRPSTTWIATWPTSWVLDGCLPPHNIKKLPFGLGDFHVDEVSSSFEPETFSTIWHHPVNLPVLRVEYTPSSSHRPCLWINLPDTVAIKPVHQSTAETLEYQPVEIRSRSLTALSAPSALL